MLLYTQILFYDHKSGTLAKIGGYVPLSQLLLVQNILHPSQFFFFSLLYLKIGSKIIYNLFIYNFMCTIKSTRKIICTFDGVCDMWFYTIWRHDFEKSKNTRSEQYWNMKKYRNVAISNKQQNIWHDQQNYLTKTHSRIEVHTQTVSFMSCWLFK